MEIQDWGAIGEAVGGIATVVTLLYLAFQIRESTALAKRAALEGVVERLAQWWRSMRSNPDVLEIYLKGNVCFSELSELDKYRYHFAKAESFAYMEAIIEQGKSNAVKSETYDQAFAGLKWELEGAGARDWWDEIGQFTFAKDFVKTVDKVISELPEAT